MAADIIIDTLDTLIALLHANGGVYIPGHRSEAERIARAAWGGDRPYIAKVGESGQQQISQRDKAIRREFAHGAHISLLARRHQLSERRVRQILSLPETACLTSFQETGQPTQQRRAKRAAPV